jgi:dTDP-4-dehydrorhamnose reductase
MECTVNRIGNDYHDQLRYTGHEDRIDDLDRIAELGIRTLRYPVLWERTAPDGPARAAWAWADERLGRLRELGIRPIVGLCHHGSGPRSTDLLDPGWPEALAAYARAVAERYPWVEDYTPVNEPLTTARFSGLYGHWYPHRTDDRSFLLALLHQCRGVALAMRAIRAVNPRARLVQTEDLGHVRSTPLLGYQAEFENQRRWLSLDLLTGRVDRRHPLRGRLCETGVDEAELGALADEPCPPDLLGFNYYLTSERFLDHELEHYPPSVHGGNGRHAYADVEAVRACEDGLVGVRTLLGQAWQRFGLPLAITEAHLGCHREDQLRWLHEIWQGAHAARADGADVRAVAVWSLFGACDWNTLVTRHDGFYEPGVFDVRGAVPRATALAELVRELASGETPSHPALAGPGWWRRDDRLRWRAQATRAA